MYCNIMLKNLKANLLLTTLFDNLLSRCLVVFITLSHNFNYFQHQQDSAELSGGSPPDLASFRIPIAPSEEASLPFLPRKSQPSQPRNLPSKLLSSRFSLTTTTSPSSSARPSTRSSSTRSTTPLPSQSSVPTDSASPPIRMTSSFLGTPLLPTNVLLPYNKKTDANQFFFLLNGPFYFTFKEPYVSNALPIFVPLPASSETKPTEVVLPLMTNQDDVHQVKALPEPSLFSNPESTVVKESTSTELTDGLMATSEMKKNLTVLMPISTEKNATLTRMILTEVVNRSTDIIGTSMVTSAEVISTSIDVMEATTKPSSEMIAKLPNSTPMVTSDSTEQSFLMANETEMSQLVQEVSRQKTFEEHLEEFLRSVRN